MFNNLPPWQRENLLRTARSEHMVIWCLLVAAGIASGCQAETIAIVNADRVNLRGRPSLSSEVVTQVHKGETVVVCESIALQQPRPQDPSAWHRIRLPEDTPVWVHAGFVDPIDKTVRVPRLNVRAGPGENYSVIGLLTMGDTVQELRVLEDWMEIQPPPDTYAYMAAAYATISHPATSAFDSSPPVPPPPTPSQALPADTRPTNIESAPPTRRNPRPKRRAHRRANPLSAPIPSRGLP